MHLRNTPLFPTKWTRREQGQIENLTPESKKLVEPFLANQKLLK